MDTHIWTHIYGYTYMDTHIWIPRHWSKRRTVLSLIMVLLIFHEELKCCKVFEGCVHEQTSPLVDAVSLPSFNRQDESLHA